MFCLLNFSYGYGESLVRQPACVEPCLIYQRAFAYLLRNFALQDTDLLTGHQLEIMERVDERFLQEARIAGDGSHQVIAAGRHEPINNVPDTRT